MGILFDSSPSEPTTLEEVVFQALGAASVCWEDMHGTGLFNSDRAKEIGNEALEWIRAHYEEREL